LSFEERDVTLRILVIGAGAIGGIVGGHLTRLGENVLLVDRSVEHVWAMQRDGLRIDGPLGEYRIRVKSSTPQELAGDFDLVLLAVKAQHTADALELIPPHLAPAGFAVSMQNGLATKGMMAEKISADRAIGAMVRLGGTLAGPGYVTQLNSGFFVVGELDGRMTERLERLRQLLEKVAPTTSSDNLFGWLWAKQTYLCLLNMTTLIGRPLNELLTIPGGKELGTRAMRECAMVARAEGIRLETFDFLDPNALLGDGPSERARTRQDLATIGRRFGNTIGDTYRDIAVRHVPSEVPFLSGEVVRRGKRLGVSTPVLEKLVDLIAAIERGELLMSPDNLRKLPTWCD
jgi:2-dehydropantoate 2-reductase